MSMRTEREMMSLILSIADNDDRIRAVYMNGSRANPQVAKDSLQDYDIVFAVTETASFLADKDWISSFGDIAMVQEPDSAEFGWGEGCDLEQSYGWLILCKDGNRIDLHIRILHAAISEYLTDTLTVLLMDKDGILPELPPSSDKGYRIKKPTNQQFAGCCNEFWWCLQNVAKGIKRDQLTYAMKMYNDIVHHELEKMMEWYIGIKTNFSVSVGMWGKYFKAHLSPEKYHQYTATYSDSDYDHLWKAVFNACDLFRDTAVEVADSCGFTYNKADDENMTAYLRHLYLMNE